MIKTSFGYSVYNRTPLENVNGSVQESWNGYVNDDDRVLLKVCT